MENQNTEVYICHYCVDYITPFKMSMKRHFNRKRECQCMNLIPYENSKILSLSKIFIFSFDYTKLLKDDFLYIIKNFNCYKNYIDKNFHQIVPPKNDFLDTIMKDKVGKCKKTSISIYDIMNNVNHESSDESEYDECDNHEENLTDEEKFKKLYYHEEKDKYICDRCEKEYTSKQNLIKHLKNPKSCELKVQINQIMEESLKIAEIRREKERKEREALEAHLVKGGKDGQASLQNFQNIQNNIQNINNNNNNTHHNTYNFAIKDFVHESYDLTHIKDSFYQQKDFFIYPNFLRMIMENKKNQNIFFANNEAIIYSDNELNKMSSDKAGYLVLDKLSQSFNQLMNKQDEEVRDFFAFITKYFNVLKGQYKHDTIFKDYDVDERRFVYTSNSGMFRSRDKYLSKIVSIINQNSNNVRQNLNIKGDEIKDIPLVNPSIEDFASARMRYRDLKDK